jgi:hypothetical protein
MDKKLQREVKKEFKALMGSGYAIMNKFIKKEYFGPASRFYEECQPCAWIESGMNWGAGKKPVDYWSQKDREWHRILAEKWPELSKPQFNTEL